MRLQVELWAESTARLPITSTSLPGALTREVPAGATLGEAQPLSPHPHSCSSRGVGGGEKKKRRYRMWSTLSFRDNFLSMSLKV